MVRNKRMAKFYANWLGVIIAVIIVVISAVIGSIYIYASSKIGDATRFATESISISSAEDGFTIIDTIDNPARYVCQISLVSINIYSLPVDVTISNVTIFLNEYQFEVIQEGSWEKTLSDEYVFFLGSFVIEQEILAELLEQDRVEIVVRGNISGSGKYIWASKTHSFEFERTAHFTSDNSS